MVSTIAILGESDDSLAHQTDLLDLQRSLRADSSLRGMVLTAETSPPQNGQLGPVTDALNWVAENKELVPSLAAALKIWLGYRKTTIRLRIGTNKIRIDSSVGDAGELADTILRALKDDESDA